jgi:conjugal transfer pilus assembly protein TraB
MPLFLMALIGWARRRPLLALVLGGLVSWVIYAQLLTSRPVVRTQVAKAQTVPQLGLERPVLEKTMLDTQKENARLAEALKDQDRKMQRLQDATTTTERERQAKADAQEARMQALVKHMEELAAQQRQAPVAKPQAKPAPKAVPAQPAIPAQPAASASTQQSARIQMLQGDHHASFTGSPPATTRADTPYLPLGSFAEGKVITGVMATSGAGKALPVLLSVSRAFTGPYALQGSGRSSLETALPLYGCFMLGKAQANLGSGRVEIQVETLSCVFPDNATFERPLKGYVVDVDGTFGIVGRLERHDSAVIAKAFLTSLMSGASEAFASARRTVQITPFGGQQSAVTGNTGELAGFSALSSAAAQLSQFYLSQAGQLLPTLWLEANHEARIVLQEGLSLEGFPPTIALNP